MTRIADERAASSRPGSGPARCACTSNSEAAKLERSGPRSKPPSYSAGNPGCEWPAAASGRRSESSAAGCQVPARWPGRRGPGFRDRVARDRARRGLPLSWAGSTVAVAAAALSESAQLRRLSISAGEAGCPLPPGQSREARVAPTRTKRGRRARTSESASRAVRTLAAL